jgi:hypothetical protein
MKNTLTNYLFSRIINLNSEEEENCIFLTAFQDIKDR